MILFKKIVGGAFQNVAEGLEVFEFDAAGLVVHHLVEVLMAQSHLDVEPVFGFPLFLQTCLNYYLTESLELGFSVNLVYFLSARREHRTPTALMPAHMITVMHQPALSDTAAIPYMEIAAPT